MKRFSKRIVSICMVMVLTLAMAFPAFAAAITPNTGTQTVYLHRKGGTSWVRVDLANGSKAFTIKRADVKLTPGTTGAKLDSFETYKSKDTTADSASGKWTSSTYINYSYNVELTVAKPGTAAVAYKIGSKAYKTKVKVLAYTNPAKLVALTGVNGGKNIASLTKTNNMAVKDLTFSANKKNPKLTVKASSGWNIRSMILEDMTTGARYTVEKDKGFASGALYGGDLTNTHKYQIDVEFQNTSNKATLYCYYYINGSKAE